MKKIKGIQYPSKEQIKKDRSMTPDQVLKFLDDFRQLYGEDGVGKEKSILISMKISPTLLRAFRIQCEQKKIHYQTQIKQLMSKWLTS